MVMPFAREDRLVEDAYGVLGLPRGATDTQVRAAWRRAARVTHPDTGGDARAFRIAREAYEILTDPVRRAAHDRLLDARAERERAERARAEQAARAARTPPPGERASAGASQTGASTSGASATAVASGPPPAGSPSAGQGSSGHGAQTRPSPSPAPKRDIAGRVRVALLVANLVVVVRALVQLAVGGIQPPYTAELVVPIGPGPTDVFIRTVDLFGVPHIFLVLAALASTLMVIELQQRQQGRAQLWDGPVGHLVRLAQWAIPMPLTLVLLLAGGVIVVQVVLVTVMLLVMLAALILVLSWLAS
jgi:curved DNA-binding protein CbpA